ncbi:hypothetical protein [Hydrogenophaga sp.]|uniref:hypothetical protein n=1 Tax=Hydrogenophaga sp. TaxID=1904254 RepID=UPI00271CCA87|nr:hypothetical protein [Hydrogenophaga sp.]MDO9605003.1 hypothetical protein [Hydrogenophaga sp.]
MVAPAIHAMAACIVCNNGIKDVSIIFPSLFCAISLRARSAQAGAAVKALYLLTADLSPGAS